MQFKGKLTHRQSCASGTATIEVLYPIGFSEKPVVSITSFDKRLEWQLVESNENGFIFEYNTIYPDTLLQESAGLPVDIAVFHVSNNCDAQVLNQQSQSCYTPSIPGYGSGNA